MGMDGPIRSPGIRGTGSPEKEASVEFSESDFALSPRRLFCKVVFISQQGRGACTCVIRRIGRGGEVFRSGLPGEVCFYPFTGYMGNPS